MIDNFSKIVPNITLKKVAQEGDFDVIHQNVRTPFIMSNRSVFVTCYHVHSADPDGEYTFLMSSAGNEKYL